MRHPFLHRCGPWAMVTGASDGIGRDLARALARRGLSLALVARREDRLRALADELTPLGVETRVIPADLGTPEGVALTLARTADLDLGLFVAAAGFGTSGPFLDGDLAAELAMIDVNVRAVAALTHPLARRLAQRGRGGVVLLSSLVAFQGVARAANYAATKAWVQSFAEGLHHELKPRGVDVLASAPGPVRSGFASRAKMTMGFAARPDDVADATLRALGRRAVVRPGWLAWLLEMSLATLPRWARVRMMGVIMAGMTPSAAPTPGASAD
jgi:short-subunit dehydrogenase